MKEKGEGDEERDHRSGPHTACTLQVGCEGPTGECRPVAEGGLELGWEAGRRQAGGAVGVEETPAPGQDC